MATTDRPLDASLGTYRRRRVELRLAAVRSLDSLLSSYGLGDD